MPAIRRRVVCGRSETIVTCAPQMALTSVDLPTLGRPASATIPHRKPSGGDWCSGITEGNHGRAGMIAALSTAAAGAMTASARSDCGRDADTAGGGETTGIEVICRVRTLCPRDGRVGRRGLFGLDLALARASTLACSVTRTTSARLRSAVGWRGWDRGSTATAAGGPASATTRPVPDASASSGGRARRDETTTTSAARAQNARMAVRSRAERGDPPSAATRHGLPAGASTTLMTSPGWRTRSSTGSTRAASSSSE